MRIARCQRPRRRSPNARRAPDLSITAPAKLLHSNFGTAPPPRCGGRTERKTALLRALFDDHAARDAATAVAAGIGLVIVGSGVDHKGGAVGIEQSAVALEARADETQRRAADLVGLDHEVGQVAMMRAHGIV